MRGRQFKAKSVTRFRYLPASEIATSPTCGEAFGDIFIVGTWKQKCGVVDTFEEINISLVLEESCPRLWSFVLAIT